MAGKLIVVGTPIGNLSDFSPRAIETLQTCDFIAAEDTRVTVKLLNHFGIKKPMVSYFEHNKMERGDIICNRMEQGEVCVLVSDAGMPAISDPGELLVAQCVQRNIPVYVVPGPTAVISALAVSGLPTGRFTFEGFLSMNKKSRREHLEEVKWYFMRLHINWHQHCKICWQLGETEELLLCARLPKYTRKSSVPH